MYYNGGIDSVRFIAVRKTGTVVTAAFMSAQAGYEMMYTR